MKGKLTEGSDLLLEEFLKRGINPDTLPSDFLESVQQVFNQYESKLALLNLTLQQNALELKHNREHLNIFIDNGKSNAEKIKQREEQMAEAQHIAHFGTWEFTLNHLDDLFLNELFWSEEVFRIFGQPSSFQVSIKSFLDMVHHDDRNDVIALVQHCVETGERYVMDHRIVLPDRTIKWVHEEAGFLFENGKPLKMVGMIFDITQRKSSEEQLNMAHQEYEILFSTIDEVFFSVDMKNWSINQISKACNEVYGYTQEEFINNADLWYEVIFTEDKFDLESHLSELKKGVPVTMQYRIVHSNGDVKWIESKLTPGLVDGELVGLYGVTRDISLARKMQQELIESELHNRNIFNQASVGMVLAKIDGTIIDINTAYADIIGYSLQEAQEMTYWEITPAIYYDLEREKLKELFKDGRYKSYEKEYIHKSGKLIPVRMSGVVISRNNEDYILSNVEDITESRHQRDIIIRANAELRKTNAELDQFVYSVSHDLRSPLCSILGIVEITEDEVSDPFTLSNLGLIKSGIRKLDTLIHDILDYSRNSRKELIIEQVNPEEILSNAIGRIQNTSGAEVIMPEINIDMVRNAELYSDKERLSMIIRNLILNSIHFRRSSIEDCLINVRFIVEHDSFKLQVTDNGTGISESNLPRVCEMFYRVSERSNGAGLGLYIVKEAVEKLGGDLSIESKLNFGTTVTVNLPNNVE